MRPPAADAPSRRRPRAPLVLLAAIVVVASAIAAYVAADRDVPTTPTAAPSPQASPSPSPSPAAALPEGWTRYEDPEDGWSVGVPSDWVRSERNDMVQFRDAEQRRTLRIDARPARGAPLEVSQRFSAALDDQLQDYEQLRLEPTTYLGQPAADLEFTFFDQVDLRVLDRTFVVPSGDGSGRQAYELYWQTHERDWEDARPVFDEVLETFVPRG